MAIAKLIIYGNISNCLSEQLSVHLTVKDQNIKKKLNLFIEKDMTISIWHIDTKYFKCPENFCSPNINVINEIWNIYIFKKNTYIFPLYVKHIIENDRRIIIYRVLYTFSSFTLWIKKLSSSSDKIWDKNCHWILLLYFVLLKYGLDFYLCFYYDEKYITLFW